MSTIVVVKKDGYAAIGADTLTSFGATKESAEYVHDPSKIIQVGENFVATVGHASWGLVLSSYFAGLDKVPSLDCPRTIFETARALHQSLKDDYFLNPVEDAEDPFESTQLDCLIANSAGIFGLYSLRSVQAYTKFYAFGSGSRYALGAMHALYPTQASAQQIARAGLQASADFDGWTGSPLNMHTVKLRDQ